ncbi:hypothetical protein M0R72_18785 [Candidatus Pacearchaeota archaeon]|jgi:hypothetical protein|nr:hypothetical protein [Candidatus Pacearchaeota archaeon]
MRQCAICGHKKRAEIEAAIIGGVGNYPAIARQYGLKLDCLKDHKRYGHIPVASLVAAEEDEEKHGIDVADLLAECLEISLGSAREAREAKAFSSIGSIMAVSLKVAEILSKTSPGSEESGLDVMRKEMKERRNVALTP